TAVRQLDEKTGYSLSVIPGATKTHVWARFHRRAPISRGGAGRIRGRKPPSAAKDMARPGGWLEARRAGRVPVLDPLLDVAREIHDPKRRCACRVRSDLHGLPIVQLRPLLS